jgi:hypothetical protein
MTSITISSLSSLIYYAMAATNKRYSYPRVAMIQIDVYPAGENTTNTLHAFYAQSAYGHRPYVSHVVYVYQPFTSHR